MNLRIYTIALLASAIPLFATAQTAISLNPGDFVAAKRIAKNGEEVVSVKLSKSGKAKFRKLNHGSVNKAVHAEIGGVTSDFTLREPIHEDRLEMGPYSMKDAEKVVTAINGN
jgi:hypothetical protein